MVPWRRATWQISAIATIAVAFVACHGARPSPPVGCPVLIATSNAEPKPGSGATPATAPVPSVFTLPMGLPEIPQAATCVIRDNVTQFDITWNLRTRLDAVASMRVRQGAVTGWIVTTRRLIHDSHYYALAQIENANALVRAWVTWEDLFVTLRKPLFINDSMIADCETERKFFIERSGTMDLYLEFAKTRVFDINVPCDEVGLARRRGSPSDLLPPKRGEVVVRWDTPVMFGGNTQEVSKLPITGHGVFKPTGALASVHHETQDQFKLLFETCGGWAYVWVDKTYVIGPPVAKWGASNGRCPNTGSGYGTIDYIPEEVWTCSKSIPIFLRTDTMQDPVGFVKVGARLWLRDEVAKMSSAQADGSTREVGIVESPVDALNDARLVVRVTDLDACTLVKVTGKRQPRRNYPKVRLPAP